MSLTAAAASWRRRGAEASHAAHLRGLSGFPLHYLYETPQFLIDLPKLIRSKLRRVGNTFFWAGHLFVPNVRHEGVVEKAPIASTNCISSCVVCLCLGHVASHCLIRTRKIRFPIPRGPRAGRLLGRSRCRTRTCFSSTLTDEGFRQRAKPPASFPTRFLSAVVIDVKVAFSFEPSEPTTVMITTEMPVTMRLPHKRSYTSI